jgi:hypothetical protein
MAAHRKPKTVELPSTPEIDAAMAELRADHDRFLAQQNGSLRIILRCHRERDQVTDIETTMAELADGVAVPSYTVRVQVVPA